MRKSFASLIAALVTFGILPLPAQITETNSFTNLNEAIPDGNASGMHDVRTISSAIPQLSSLRVKLQIVGEFNGDLYGYVRHVWGGTTNFCVLLNRVGRTATNSAGYADSGLDVLLDDAAPLGDIHVYGTVTNLPAGTPLSGTWQPDGRWVDPDVVLDTTPRTATLSSFTNADGNGEWTLFLADLACGGTNMLVSWELQLTGIATPAVTWPTPGDIVYGTALGSGQLNASSPVPGTFTYSPPAGAVLNAGSNLTLSVTFQPTDTNSYASVTTNVSINVLQAPLTVSSGLAANNKVYDGTTSATINSNNVVLAGVVGADVVSLATNGYAASFGSAGVSNGIAVSVSGLTLAGSSATNYTLTQPVVLAANITGKALTVSSGLTANNKVYDGTTSATINSNNVVLAGVVGTDVVSLSTNGYGASFASAGVSNGVAVSVSGLSLSGGSATNYTLTQPVVLAGNITGKALTVSSGLTANNKVYDGTTSATINSNNVVLAGVVGTDVVSLSTNGYGASFASAGVSNGIAVSVSGLTLAGSSATNYTLTQPVVLAANITGKALTVSSGLTANNKVYDGTTSATISSNNVVLAGVVGADVVKLSTNGYAASFASAGVSNGIAVSVSGLNLSGSSATNYTLTQPVVLAANITGKALTVSSGLAANNKVYDGTTSATISSNNVVLGGVVGTDVVSLSTNGYAASFASAGVSNGIAVSVSGLSLSGGSATNYTLTQPVGLAANITGKALTVSSGLTANNKVYDGTTSATITSNTVVLAGVVGADVVSLSTNGYGANFASAGVSNGIAVSVSGLTLSGSSATNYTLTQPVVLAANITGKALTVSSGLAANSKVYDGTTSATISSNNVVLAGVVGADVVSLSTNGYAASFASAGVSNGIAVSVSGLTLAGSSATNYTLTQPVVLAANITGKALTVSSGLAANNKVYDGTTSATINSNTVVLGGVAGTDVVSLSTNGYGASFASAGVNNGIAVSVSGLTLSGSSATNYTLTQPVVLAANITGKALTVSSGLAANNKVYDGTTSATISSNSVVLAGVVGADMVSLSTNGYGASFASAGVSNGIAVSVSGLTLAGSSATNYTLTQPVVLAANITGKALTVSSGLAANNKVYDGTTSATISSNSVVLAGVVGADVVTLSTNGYGANFASAGVSNGIAVSVSGLSLSGSSATNYTLTQPVALAANITGKALTVSSGLTANNKVYDGTTSATISSNSVVLAGVVGADVVSLSTNGYGANFASAGVSNGIAVSVSGLSLSGSSATNYTLTQPVGLAANITGKALTITANNTNKVYGQTVTFAGTEFSSSGLVNNDTVTSVTLTSAGTGATATVAGSPYSIVPSAATGTGLANYTIGYVAGTLTVTPAGTIGALTSSPNPSLPGQPVAFTFTLNAVAPGAGTPTGTAQFSIDGTNAGGPVSLSGGVAGYSTTNLAHGTHTVVAEYAGDGNFTGATNSLSPPQLIDTPPVAGPCTITRDATNGTKVSVATLLSNCSDADGDPISFVGVSATSFYGGTVVSNGGWIFYTPAPGFTNSDTFTYTISDGWVSATGTVTVNVVIDNGPSPNLTISNLGNGSYAVSGDGVPNRTYQIQFADTVPPTNWQTLGSASADQFGFFQLIDTNGAPQRFYRSVYP